MSWAGRMVAWLVLSLSGAPALAGPVAVAVPARPPVVVRADIDRLEPDRLVIHGRNFGVASPPIVVLSNVLLEVVSFSDEQIVVRWPVDAPAGRYRLQVLAYGAPPSALFEVTLGGGPSRRSES
ncbi:MAG: hypothetical protein ACREM3_15105 [Candidatus Rokuibacteriota bacterium]